jgi:membrane protease YdiL (CAAX protease family)
MAALQEDEAPGSEPARRHLLWIELGVISLLTWIPSFVTDFDLRIPLYPDLVSSLSRFISLVGRAAAAIFIVWTADGSTKLFGLTKPNWKKDALVTAGLIFLSFVLYLAPAFFLPRETYRDLTRHDIHSPSISFVIAGVPIAVVLIVLAGSVFFEEVVFRAYFISRFEELFGHSWNAIVVAAILFGIGHYYQGVLGTVTAVIFGVLCGIAFVLTRRLWPSLIAHYALDAYSVLHLYFAMKARGL